MSFWNRRRESMQRGPIIPPNQAVLYVAARLRYQDLSTLRKGQHIPTQVPEITYVVLGSTEQEVVDIYYDNQRIGQLDHARIVELANEWQRQLNADPVYREYVRKLEEG